MRKIIPLLLMTLLFAACGNQTAPDPDEVTKLVEKAVQATLAAQPTQPPAATVTVVSPTLAPVVSEEETATATPNVTSTVAPTNTPMPTATFTPTKTPTEEPTATPTLGPSVIADKTVNLRAGPGTEHPVIGAMKPGETYSVQGRNNDGTWFEICCVNQRNAWVAASVVRTAGEVASIQIAKIIPTPPLVPQILGRIFPEGFHGQAVWSNAGGNASLNFVDQGWFCPPPGNNSAECPGAVIHFDVSLPDGFGRDDYVLSPVDGYVHHIYSITL